MTTTQQNLTIEAGLALTEGNFTEWLNRLNDCELRLLQHKVLPELAASVTAGWRGLGG